MVELTIEITNWCDNECDFCSSDATTEGKHLPFEVIKDFLSKYNDIIRINISGGEPLAHPDFYKILRYCKMLTENVWVYTNAIPNIAYNTHVLKEINVMANVCIVPGRKVYIPKGSFSTHILEFVPQGRGKDIPTVPTTVSGNLAGGERCITCNQPTLMANGKVVTSPCRKG
jgi:organic radical activating enzyme